LGGVVKTTTHRKGVIKMALCDSCSPKRWCSVVDKSRTECKFYQPFTNEEYIKSLDTEQLAEMLANESKNVINDFENFDFKREHKEFWEMWLKQPHTNE
jgi:hypothetical protein